MKLRNVLICMLTLVMVLCMAACTGTPATTTTTAAETTAAEETTTAAAEGETAKVLTYEEYAAAAMDTEVTVETYVQAKQSWWENKATIYTQDENGAYFLYEAVCSEEDYAKLEEGTKIRVTGYKGEFEGEVEILQPTIEILEGNYVAETMDATALLGTDELINHQNKKVAFKGMTVEASKDASGNEAAFLYAWDGSGEEGGDSDLYFNASVDGKTYTFVIEYYLMNETTDAYKAVQNLKIGDTIDMEGFLYWYQGSQPHITSVTVK